MLGCVDSSRKDERDDSPIISLFNSNYQIAILKTTLLTLVGHLSNFFGTVCFFHIFPRLSQQPPQQLILFFFDYRE